MLLAKAREAGINLRRVGPGRIGISLDETTAREDVQKLLNTFAGFGAEVPQVADLDGEARQGIPKALRRTSAYLTHTIFNLYHGETEILRSLRRLKVKDIALARSLLPLGSCPMTLTATTETQPNNSRS